jgi:hypothetical protein
VAQFCTLTEDPEQVQEACTQACLSDADFQSFLAQAQAQSCPQTQALLCREQGYSDQPSCTCPEPNTGEPCDMGQACYNNEAATGCILTLGGQDYPGGYCTTVGCEPGQCGADGRCITVRTNEEERRLCMRDCTPGNPQCREGYGCHVTDDNNTRGVCTPSCATDEDCNGLICVEGRCIQDLPCATDADTSCPEGTACLDGYCLKP